jgi:hypothetical protein
MTEERTLRVASLLACKRIARERLLIAPSGRGSTTSFAAANCRTRRGAVSSESLICAKLIFPINCRG